jgi:hypothetical protein
MSAIPYVRHPKFSPAELNGKSLAWCEAGSVVQCRLRVGEQASDGRHTLMAGWAAIYSTHSKDEETSAFREPLLDQATVEKIVAVEPAADPQLRGFDFALIQEAQTSRSTSARL